MADSTYFEVRCESCRTSFAPGTKRCIHCGAPLGRSLFGALRDPTRTSAEEILGGATEAPGTGSRAATIFRIIVIGLVVLSALGRACLE